MSHLIIMKETIRIRHILAKTFRNEKENNIKECSLMDKQMSQMF